MKFVLDENFPCSAASLLIELGHNAVVIRSEGLGGSAEMVFRELCVHQDPRKSLSTER